MQNLPQNPEEVYKSLSLSLYIHIYTYIYMNIYIYIYIYMKPARGPQTMCLFGTDGCGVIVAQLQVEISRSFRAQREKNLGTFLGLRHLGLDT